MTFTLRSIIGTITAYTAATTTISRNSMTKTFRIKKTFYFGLLFLNSAAFGTTHAQECTLIDRQTFLKAPDIEAHLKTIYLNAFSAVYKDYWSLEFEKKSIKYCNGHLEKFKTSNDMFLITILDHNALAGWALFQTEGLRAILEIICVDPVHWQKGLGKKLVFSIRTFCPKINTIIVFTRTINTISPLFYESLGFKKTDFSLPEYSKDQGFEWVLE
jgi:N-acetylglutamate synthase-like GNAT family acetyltransferase